MLWLVGLVAILPAHAATNIFPEFKHAVMTWVPPYAVAKCKARLTESFGGAGMKDALTHLGLQFWLPTKEGGLARAGRTNEVMGLPSGRNEWRGSSVTEQLQWLRTDDQVGVSFWDARLKADAWRKPGVWKMLGEIRGRP